MSAAMDIETRSAEWLLRRGEEGWSSADEQELEAWLAQSTAHRAAFWRLEAGFERVGRLAVLRPGRSPRPPRTPMVWRAAAIAASLVCVVSLAAITSSTVLNPTGRSADEIHLETGLGGREVAPLQDGSKVELGAKTRMRAAINKRNRVVWLDDGQAYFEVAHDTSKPFVVHAGGRAITVLGTKFSVRVRGDVVKVVVLEGRVQVDSGDPGAAGNAQILKAGGVALADGVSTLVTTVSPSRLEDEFSWRRGVLVFDQEPLSTVVAEFNRYSAIQLEVTDRETAATRIGGSFEAPNAEAFVRLLQSAYGLKIERVGDRIKISG